MIEFYLPGRPHALTTLEVDIPDEIAANPIVQMLAGQEIEGFSRQNQLRNAIVLLISRPLEHACLRYNPHDPRAAAECAFDALRSAGRDVPTRAPAMMEPSTFAATISADGVFSMNDGVLLAVGTVFSGFINGGVHTFKVHTVTSALTFTVSSYSYREQTTPIQFTVWTTVRISIMSKFDAYGALAAEAVANRLQCDHGHLPGILIQTAYHYDLIDLQNELFALTDSAQRYWRRLLPLVGLMYNQETYTQLHNNARDTYMFVQFFKPQRVHYVRQDEALASLVTLTEAAMLPKHRSFSVYGLPFEAEASDHSDTRAYVFRSLSQCIVQVEDFQWAKHRGKKYLGYYHNIATFLRDINRAKLQSMDAILTTQTTGALNHVEQHTQQHAITALRQLYRDWLAEKVTLPDIFKKVTATNACNPTENVEEAVVMRENIVLYDDLWTMMKERLYLRSRELDNVANELATAIDQNNDAGIIENTTRMQVIPTGRDKDFERALLEVTRQELEEIAEGSLRDRALDAWRERVDKVSRDDFVAMLDLLIDYDVILEREVFGSRDRRKRQETSDARSYSKATDRHNSVPRVVRSRTRGHEDGES